MLASPFPPRLLTESSSLYKLHQIAAIQPETDEYPGYRQAVEVAQNTMTRMVIDICYAFNRESQNINIEILSPAVAHIVRTAERHMLTAEAFHNPLWLEDFDQLRRTLEFFNRRWVLAGNSWLWGCRGAGKDC